jgi:hypothetical protein
MKLKDFQRLRKLMQMTTSENDGEALNAVRAANKIIAGANVDWNRFFDRTVRIDIEVTPENKGRHDATHTASDENNDIASAFRSIDRSDQVLGERRAETVESLRKWYDEKGFLTEKQKGLLFTIEDEVTR